MPQLLAAGSYLGLVAAMLAVGSLVAGETGRTGTGLAAMALVGISTVTYPAVTWYSASQALWAGAAIVMSVAFARSWSARGGVARFVGMTLGAVLAPALWSGGLVAGPAAIAYLLARNRSRVRWQALLMAAISAAAVLLVVILSRRQIGGTSIVWERHPDLWPRPIQALLHTAQAMVEVCVFANLGIDAITTPWQAVGLLFALAVLHAWSRGGFGRFNPLEASGATIAFGSCLLTYAFRGNLPFSSLRGLGWYYAIPHIGAIVFAMGWWMALAAPRPGRLSRGQAAQVICLVVVFYTIQIPRLHQLLLQGAPPLSPIEAETLPIPELRLLRARYYKSESHYLQVRALARLDRVDVILARLGMSPETLRDIMGRVLIPGIPEKQLSSDAFSILTPRPRNADSGATFDRYRAELMTLLSPEPPPVRSWLDPDRPRAQGIRKESADRPGSRQPL